MNLAFIGVIILTSISTSCVSRTLQLSDQEQPHPEYRQGYKDAELYLSDKVNELSDTVQTLEKDLALKNALLRRLGFLHADGKIRATYEPDNLKVDINKKPNFKMK